MKTRFLICVLAIACTANLAYAEPKEKGAKRKPEAYPPTALELPAYTNIQPEVLDMAVRASLKEAVLFFTELSKKDEVEGWIVPPHRQRIVVDTIKTNYTVRYSKKIVERPVYEHEYETYEVMVPVKSGNDTGAVTTYQKVQRKRVKSRRQTGTRKVETLVHDTNGPIEKVHTRVKHIYGPGGPDIWRMNALGDNALVLYACRAAGVDVRETPVKELAAGLSSLVTDFGMPDSTWDLAWMTAAFATMPTDRYRNLAGDLASKLMDGQITDGAARGLWGPVCVNTALLGDLVPRVQKLGAAAVHAKRQAKASLITEEELLDAEAAYRTAATDLSRVALCAMAGPHMETRYLFKSEIDDAIYLPGLVDYVYNQRSADVESTSIALFALRKAKDYRVLRDELWRPDTPIREDLRKHARAEVVLSRAAHAIARTQKDDAGWTELNWHQSVKDFAKSTVFPGLPPKVVAFPRLKSDTTLLSNAQGFTALVNIGHTIGFDRLMKRYAKKVAAGNARYRELVEKLLEEHPSTEELGGFAAPFECIMFMADAARNMGSLQEDRRDLWARLSSFLLAMRHVDGSWKIKKEATDVTREPTSLLARMAAMKDPKRPTDVDLSAPHVGWHAWRRKAVRDSARRGRIEDVDVLPTAMAMIVLADSVRPPVAGDCGWSEPEILPQLASVITSVMQARHGVPLRYVKVTRPVTGSAVSALPGIVIRGSGSFAPSVGEKDALRSYLAANGLVIVVAPADAAGKQFCTSASEVLAKLVPNSFAVDNIGGDSDLLGSLAGRVAFKGLKRADASLSAAFINVAKSRRAPGMPGQLAGEIVHNLLLQKEDPAVLKASYPIDVETEGTATQLILHLLTGTPMPTEEVEEEAPSAEAEPADGETEVEDDGLREDEAL